jgi:hypothetical protein
MIEFSEIRRIGVGASGGEVLRLLGRVVLDELMRTLFEVYLHFIYHFIIFRYKCQSVLHFTINNILNRSQRSNLPEFLPFLEQQGNVSSPFVCCSSLK